MSIRRFFGTTAMAVACGLSLSLVAAQPYTTTDPGLPQITSTVVDYTAKTLTISGSNESFI
jgi:hypothetical protein